MTRWPDKRFAEVPPDATAVELATAVREAVEANSGRSEAYCDLAAVCKAGGFLTVHVSHNDVDHLPEALLVPSPEGTFTIVVRSDDYYRERIGRQRSRFRIAHEIGHSFFYDRSRRPPRKLTNDSKTEERFCDRFASALLVPPNAIAQYQPSPDAVFALHDTHDVSVEVAGRACASHWQSVCVAGILSKVNPRDDIKGLRVQWSAGPQFIPPNARLHSKAVDRAYRDEQGREIEQLNVGGLKGLYEVQASRAKNGSLVVAVIRSFNPRQ